MPRERWSIFRKLSFSLQQHARIRLLDFKYDTLPTLKARVQSKIYASLISHQQKKRRKPTRSKIFPFLAPNGRRKFVDERTATMNAYYPEGSRRAKFAGYLQTANKLRQDYQARRVGAEDYPDVPGDHIGVKVSRHGDEELLIFPSYARSHVKNDHRRNEIAVSTGPGDADYWKREWEIYEDANAVVDVDIRGWVYSNLKGPMNRRNRLILAAARQLSGIPAPNNDSGYGNSSLADPQSHSARHESEDAQKEAELIERRGQRESALAQQGAYSLQPGNRFDEGQDSDGSGMSTPSSTLKRDHFDDIGRRDSWTDPSEFTPAELERANDHLMKRLRPFLTNPSANMALTIFYYNDQTSQSRTTMTNEYGHFNFRAALNFVPTHVRVLAGERLSATEAVQVTENAGISLISDIDDTVKHSAISAGAKEIFRNTFIRDLADLTINGVRQWYGKMYDAGVKLHFVSNSPWQLYPLLAEYFTVAGLPPGSIHLKQYTGVLQGIFEPAAERKKGSLDRILSDFPERRFILVGDSGEADLEVYTEVALTYPNRIIAIFIRDVTSPQKQGLGFFNSAFSSNGKPLGTGGPRQEEQWHPALPPRPIPASAAAEGEDLIDLSDEPSPAPPSRSNTDPLRPGSSSSSLPLRPVQSSGNSYTVPRKAPPAPPPKPRQFSSNPKSNPLPPPPPPPRGTAAYSTAEYTEAPCDRPDSLRGSRPASITNSASQPGSSGPPLAEPRFGQGSLSFVNDGLAGNGRPAPPLPPRRVGAPYRGGATRQYSELPPTNRKEEMWKRRWIRAREMLEERGVVLRAWRTGTDVVDEALRLVNEARKNER